MTILTADQARHLNRSQTVQTYFTENKDKYTLLKPLEKQVNLLMANNKKIVSLIPAKGEKGTGVTEEKKDLKTVIAESAGTICSFAADYALEISDMVLYKLVNYTASDILQLRDAEVLGFIDGVVDTVTPLLTEPGFADYPVTGEQLDELSGSAATYNDNIGKAAIIDTKSGIASRNINTILKAIRLNLFRIDKMIVYFKKDDPDFVIGYYKAAILNNSGIRHSGIKGIILNSATGQPAEKVIVTLTGKTNTKTVTTNSDGAYEIPKFVPGKCRLTITAPGCQTYTADISIVRGKTLELNVELQSQITKMETA